MRSSDTPFAALALAAAAFVLAAPVAGRAGYPAFADLLMALAAAAGVVGFGLASFHTLRAARRRAAPHERRTDP